MNDMLVILVAHPRKMSKIGSHYEVPTLYDISGSAHFFNKTDYGLSIYRLLNETKSGFSNTVQIHVQKVKFKHLGQCGMIEMNYNYENGRFEDANKDCKFWDKKDWIVIHTNETLPEFNKTISDDLPF